MSDNLARTADGRIAMAYQGETPWHTLGTSMTPEIAGNLWSAFDAAGLDYTVALHDLFLAGPDRTLGVQVPNRRAIVREDTGAILGTVSGWYRPIQNREHFGIFEGVMNEFGLTVEAAGALGKGERAWMLFRLPIDVTPVPGDDVRGYGLAVTGHDGRTIAEFRPTPIRVVCQNTLDAAVGAGAVNRSSIAGRTFSVPHIGDVAKGLDEARDLVTNVMRAMAATGETFAQMAQRRMTPAEVVAYVETVFPTPRSGEISEGLADRRRTVAELIFSGIGADLATSSTNGEPNAWACYNAVTEYFDHVVTGAAKSAAGARVANTSAIFGKGAEAKLAALAAARELVAA